MMLKGLRKIIRPRGPQTQLPQESPQESDQPLSLILRKYEVSPERGHASHPSPPSIWTIPLPPDLLFFIIDHHFVGDQPTLRALSNTCRVLTTYCRRLIYRSVAIGHRDRGPLSTKKKPAIAFAELLRESPGIVEYIEDLQILDGGGRMFEGSRPITEEEQSLCFILTRPMKNLKRLELMLNVVWTLIPPPLQEALGTAFRLPSICTLAIDKLRFPVNLLDIFQDLGHIEFFGEAAAPIMVTTTLPHATRSVKPETFTLTDWTGVNVKYLFSSNSPLRLSRLQCLRFRGCGSAISDHLQLCTSLTVLKLFLTDFHPQNLSALRSLTFLTLSQDLTIPLWVKRTKQFQWMLSTLATCSRPNAIEGIRIILQTPYLAQREESDWSGLDALLTAPGGWPRLKCLEVVSLTAESEMKWSGANHKISPPLLPLLIRGGVEVSSLCVYQSRTGFGDHWLSL